MNRSEKTVYPYIPNSAPQIQEEMMKAVGVTDLWDLYEEIPEELKFRGELDIPPAILDEYSMKRHIGMLLDRNVSASEYISFLGGGCAGHYVPAVVDEITTRGEFLTCYGAESWADHGKYQTYVEYNSMLAELLGTEVISVPQYDGGQALATSVCMANRINGRTKTLLPASMNPQNKRILTNYLDSVQDELVIDIEYVDYDKETGMIDLKDLEKKLGDDVSSVMIEPVSFLGVMEANIEEAAKMVKAAGAELIVYVDPISLGLMEAPVNYGADIVCGDLHSLGLHLSCGNGQAGFISTMGEAKYMNEYKDFIYGFCEPEVEGEYVFGNLLISRTHYAQRAKGKEYTGTGVNLWMVSAAVYMALMGPKGFEELDETILLNTAYAAAKLAEIPGVKPAFSGNAFGEVTVDFSGTGRSVKDINKALLSKGIFGGLDLSGDFPELGQSALYCITETTGKAEIDALADALAELLQ